MELELISPYLPYEVNVQITHRNKTSVERLIGIYDGYVLIKGGEWSFEKIKLILRPLSDLTKEIEIDGENMSMVEWLKKRGFGFPDHTWVHLIKELPYWVIEKLYALHFDIDGLIEKGLAVDINKING